MRQLLHAVILALHNVQQFNKLF
jgi:signal transduction histidine kinase